MIVMARRLTGIALALLAGVAPAHAREVARCSADSVISVEQFAGHDTGQSLAPLGCGNFLRAQSVHLLDMSFGLQPEGVSRAYVDGGCVMKRVISRSVLVVVVVVACGLLMKESVHGQTVQRYMVSVTNMTRAQTFTPILVATHTQAVRMFTAGTAASPELRELAEEGNTDPFTTLLRGIRDVRDVVTVAGLLTPGVTAGIEVMGGGSFDRISVAAMLIPTNDAFFAVTGLLLPTGNEPLTVDAPAYDAGTERNDERCASIPGPNFAECGGPGGGARVGGGEGAVTIHNGIRGVGDLRANDRDWRNPVARITIRRVQ